MQFDMKIYFLMSIFLLAGGSGSLTAQTVSGKVVNTEQQPIDGATIIPVSYTHLTLPTTSRA